jgi:multiple sugar transport system substrate-binding protein
LVNIIYFNANGGKKKMKKLSIFLMVMVVLALVIVACQPETETVEVTRVVTETEEVVVTQVVEKVVESAPVEVEVTRVVETVVEVPVEPAEKTVVEFWSTDKEPDRVELYEQIAARFMAENPGIDVRIVAIDEAEVSQRIATAVGANRLPDMVRMGIERVAAFAADGILDEAAAEAVIASVGEDDFRVGPLAMVTDPATGMYAAVPFDGWIQAIWYRSDVFVEAGLNPPITWEDILAACETLPGTGNLLYALTLGTDPGQNYGHQVFEQVAISNNAWPFDADGNVTMNSPEMIEALDFYTSLQDCAVPGPQYWRGAREAYQLDQSGMLFYSTYIMDDLVDGSGLEAGGNVDIQIENLPENTGFASEMVGPNGSASYGQLVTMAIMQGADPEAQQVAEYFLTEGYAEILSLAPFGKVPVLESAVEPWKSSSDYFANYSSETLDQIADGYNTMQRWLFRPDYDATQRAVVGDIEGRLLIPTAISNIALEGIMTPETAAQWLQEQVEAIYAERLEG